LAFHKTHQVIKQKFNELLHNDGVKIFNYLIMENLTSQEYEKLNDSLKTLLPHEKILFSDSSETDIVNKLHNAQETNTNLPSINIVFGTLFIQYAIIEIDKEPVLCTQEQINFIDQTISGVANLVAPPQSGKSYTLLLKSIQELFQQKRQKIIIIKPTMLSKEILYKHFLELIEHAIIEFDLMAFEILTPLEFINKHLQKLKMPLINELFIEEKLLKKDFFYADLIMCDDSNLMPADFIFYLKTTQKRSDLLLINDKNTEAVFQFTQSYFHTPTQVHFHKTNPYAKALHLVSLLLNDFHAKDIVIIANDETRQKIQEDLSQYIKDKTILFDASKHLLEQEVDVLLLLTYKDIVDIKAKQVILIDICSQEIDILHYAFGMTKEKIHILYEKECEHSKLLKEKYENKKN